MTPPETAAQHRARADMYSDARLNGVQQVPPPAPESFLLVDDEDDDDAPARVPDLPALRMVAAPRPAAAPTLSEVDQTGLAFWRRLNEAEQNWLRDSGEIARGLIRWASKLSRDSKVLRIRAFSGEGEERRPLMTNSFRYVAVAEDDLTFWFTLTPDSIPPEFELGTKVEIEYDDGPPRRVLTALARSNSKFPYPELVFFPDDEHS